MLFAKISNAQTRNSKSFFVKFVNLLKTLSATCKLFSFHVLKFHLEYFIRVLKTSALNPHKLTFPKTYGFFVTWKAMPIPELMKFQ